mmetsp:Transcript_10217/g.35280  ORF Transcript_10217/g.35280 Transcript_10217/m.35280 type:complete len:324 (+) Transcript_10217:660-1631(+)
MAVSARGDQPVDIEDPKPLPGLLLRDSVLRHGLGEEGDHAHASAARAADHKLLRGKRGSAQALDRQRAVDPPEHRRGRALDVVVEYEVVVAVPVQQGLGVIRAKVLELNQHVWVPRQNGAHELVDELVVCVALQPLPPQTKVQGVVQQLFVVGAHIDDDRHDARRVEPSARAVDIELADGDAQPVHAQVSQTQNARSVRHDDGVNFLRRPVVHEGGHDSPVLLRDEEAPGLPVDQVEVLATPAHGGSVHDGGHLLEVVEENLVKEHLVPVLQTLQSLPFSYVLRSHRLVFRGDVCDAVFIFGHKTFDLLLERYLARRQQPPQP